MRMNMDAVKALEMKLAEYSKENGAIAEHASGNVNRCQTGCFSSCEGTCKYSCGGSCGDSGAK